MNLKNIPIDDIRNQLIKKNTEETYFRIYWIIILRLLQRTIPFISANFLYLFLRYKKNSKPIIGFSNIYYNGQPRAVFEYMLKLKDKYEIFWIGEHLKTIKEVKKAGGNAFLLDGLLGIPKFLKTDLWIISHIGRDIPFLPHKNFKIIQLWHGIGPKGINFRKNDYEKYDGWCVASEYSKKRHIELWDAIPEKLFVTGFAEMDILRNYLKMDKEELIKDINRGARTILYAPTYDVGLWPWGEEYKEFEKLCSYCKEKNLILILRLHPYAKINKTKLEKIIQNYDNVYWFDMSDEPDTMKLLAISDILITDWSSIYTNYFLTKRPIIYLEIDKYFYTELRGKPEIPPEFRAGEIIKSNEEFYNVLDIVLKIGNRHEEEQERLLNIIHGKIDGKASERVVKIIEKLIKNN
jgi:CDP-glycerol glycerophosphotransferase